MIPPAGLGANSSVTATTLKMFGDMSGDGVLKYVEYNYDSAHGQITRSMTPITSATKSAPLPLMTNIKSGSANFTLYTDNMGVVTSVVIGLSVRGTVKNGASSFQETTLSSRVVIPSAVAASAIQLELQQYGGVDRLPPTPSKVSTWVSQ